MADYSCFRFWCQKVLPLVYDDSLSYYEVVCKLADGFAELNKAIGPAQSDIADLQQAVKDIQDELERLENGEYAQLMEIISNTIKQVYFGLTDAGYFVAYIPESWSDIVFNTTGYDYALLPEYNYGHLVLSMDVENPEWGPNYQPGVKVPVTPVT